MFACSKCVRPKWANDSLLIGQWLAHAFVPAIARDI